MIFQVASRLSYFLWSSMPDQQLLDLARAGKLRDAAVLKQQVDRMLDDPRIHAFTHHFTERWLRLDKIADSPPELNGPFRVYWDRKMEPQIIYLANGCLLRRPVAGEWPGPTVDRLGLYIHERVDRERLLRAR